MLWDNWHVSCVVMVVLMNDEIDIYYSLYSCHIISGIGHIISGIGHIKLYRSIVAQCLTGHLSRWQCYNYADGSWINNGTGRCIYCTTGHWCAANLDRSYMAGRRLFKNMMMQMMMTSRCNASNCCEQNNLWIRIKY